MQTADPLDEPARAELAVLLPLRESLARRAGALRDQVVRAGRHHPERLYARALRCDRVVRQLDTRIRHAAERLASGRVAPVAGAEHEAG
ncbi:MAG TPA: hypothetical protein VII78_20900 [Myxococcota bacterium]|jgi:hypothetical protein